jgi:type I restriction enzyme M protein
MEQISISRIEVSSPILGRRHRYGTGGILEDFAYHQVSVVFGQFDEHDQPATITEPYEKAFTAANLKKVQDFYDSDLTFHVPLSLPAPSGRRGGGEGEKTQPLTLGPKDNAAKKFKALMDDQPEILSVEWTHRHYVKDDKYIPHGEDIEAFLKREIAKPITLWEDSQQLGYEILPNKYFCRYQPPIPAKELPAELWRLEKEAEKMLKGLSE